MESIFMLCVVTAMLYGCECQSLGHTTNSPLHQNDLALLSQRLLTELKPVIQHHVTTRQCTAGNKMADNVASHIQRIEEKIENVTARIANFESALPPTNERWIGGRLINRTGDMGDWTSINDASPLIDRLGETPINLDEHQVEYSLEIKDNGLHDRVCGVELPFHCWMSSDSGCLVASYKERMVEDQTFCEKVYFTPTRRRSATGRRTSNHSGECGGVQADGGTKIDNVHIQ